MTDLLQNYRAINAREIVIKNITLENFDEDLSQLIKVLNDVSMIIKLDDTERTSALHSTIIGRLDSKPGTFDLLLASGYEQNQAHQYTWKAPRDQQRRKNVANEFFRFHSMLKEAKKHPNQLKNYLVDHLLATERPEINFPVGLVPPTPNRPSSAPIVQSRPLPYLLPSPNQVSEGNASTTERINSLKTQIATSYSASPALSFVRRKILWELMGNTLNYPEDLIDFKIDGDLSRLRKEERRAFSIGDDEVYLECLIRSNGDAEKACEMLRTARPDLKVAPNLLIRTRQQTTSSVSAIQSITGAWRRLQALNNSQSGAPSILHVGDEWKNAVHIVPAIVRIRQENNQSTENKMLRMLYSELSHTVHERSEIKMESLASVLAQLDIATVQKIRILDLKDIMTFSVSLVSDSPLAERYEKALNIQCPLCYDSYPRTQMDTFLLCNHAVCVDCMRGYYQAQISEINNFESLNILTCYEEHPLPHDRLEQMTFFQMLEVKLKSLFPDQLNLLNLYQENLFLATKASNIRNCANPTCTASFEVDENRGGDRPGRIQCPHCQYEQCRSCRRRWYAEHTGRSCPNYETWLIDNDPNDPGVQLTKYLEIAGMICPNKECNAIYEYLAGACEHFTCRQCRTEFCRICSAIFHNPNNGTLCPVANCPLRNSVHAHCALNCYREIRDTPVENIEQFLESNGVDVDEELAAKPVATGPKCPVEGCSHAPAADRDNRLCEPCYVAFLCLLVWRNRLKPWELFDDNQLRVRLQKVNQPVPEQISRADLIRMADEHLSIFLGQPKPLPRIQL